MRKTLTRLCIVLLVMLPPALTGWWWYRFYSSQGQTCVVGIGDVLVGVTVSGTIRSREKSAISAEVLGLVKSLPVREGQSVSAGDLLVGLDDSVILAEVTRARANEELAAQKLAELEAGPRKEEIAAARAEVARAEAEVAFAESEHSRVAAAAKVGAATGLEVHGAGTRLSKARESLNSTKAMLDLLLAGTRPGQTAAAKASLALAKADVQRCLAMQEKCQLRAPTAGIVTVRYTNVGEVVTPGQVLLRLENLDSMEVRAQVQESQLRHVEKGAKAHVLADAYPETPVLAVVDQILPRVDSEHGAITVSLAFEGKPAVMLMDGMAADVAIVREERHQVLRVPEQVVSRRKGAATVQVRSSNGFPVQPVSLGASDGAWVEVLSGLSVGDEIRLP